MSNLSDADIRKLADAILDDEKLKHRLIGAIMNRVDATEIRKSIVGPLKNQVEAQVSATQIARQARQELEDYAKLKSQEGRSGVNVLINSYIGNGSSLFSGDEVRRMYMSQVKEMARERVDEVIGEVVNSLAHKVRNSVRDSLQSVSFNIDLASLITGDDCHRKNDSWSVDDYDDDHE